MYSTSADAGAIVIVINSMNTSSDKAKQSQLIMVLGFSKFDLRHVRFLQMLELPAASKEENLTKVSLGA